MNITLFYITYPNKKKALSLSNKLLKKKLIACYNIHKMQSGYYWNDQLQNDTEWVAILKTTSDCSSKIKKYIQIHHPYVVPCIMQWEVKVNNKYGKWINSSIG